MFSYTLEPNSVPLAQFDVPYMGTWNSAAMHKVPLSAVYLSNNIFVREGKLRGRPGLVLLNDTFFDSPVMGARLTMTPYGEIAIAVTSHGLYELSESATQWNKTSSLTFTDTLTPVDFAFMETSSQHIGFIAVAGRELRQWNSLTHATSSITPTQGIVPSPKSVCVAARRVVALTGPHTLDWSAVFDYTKWVGRAKISQTDDMGICVRSISSRAFVVYKERSIYLANAQAGGDTVAFNFSEPIEVEGPAGIHAVVRTPKMHMYMTRNGRIAVFDGSTWPKWIADGVWLYLQKDIDPRLAHKIHGVYDFRLHTVTFYYPKVNDAGLLRGMVIVCLPMEGMDTVELTENSRHKVFLGTSALSISASCEIRFAGSIDRSCVFSDTQRSFIVDEAWNYDWNDIFQCSFTTGLIALPDAKYHMVTIENFFEREHGYGNVTIEPVFSEALERKDGYTPDLQGEILNLEMFQGNEYIGFNMPTRFFGLRYSWDSTSYIRYAGSIVYGTRT